MKIYSYYFGNKYYITILNPNDSEFENFVMPVISPPNSLMLGKLGINIKKWKKLTIKHNGEIKNYSDCFDSVFPTKEDAENFIKELMPYIIMATLTEE